MDDVAIKSDIEKRTRKRLTRFLSGDVPWRNPLSIVMNLLKEHQWPAVLFGGTIRDLAYARVPFVPRDIDIVVHDVTSEALANIFQPWLRRMTRFGGLHLDVHGWLFDIWPLARTWAFQSGAFGEPSFEKLPKTTFLTVEAVAAQLFPPPRHQRIIYTHNFFESVRTKSIDINFPNNPFPALAVVRSLITAAKMGFAISPRLAEYILTESKLHAMEEFIEVQRQHYGMIRCDALELSRWIEAIDAQFVNKSARPIRLPLPKYRQLQLWDWVRSLSETDDQKSSAHRALRRKCHPKVNSPMLWSPTGARSH